jgi:hypothetical protein
MSPKDYVFAAIPMLLPTWYLLELMDQNPLAVIGRWIEQGVRSLAGKEPLAQPSVPPVGSQLLAYVGVAIFGFLVTNHLIPNIQVRKRNEGRLICTNCKYCSLRNII